MPDPLIGKTNEEKFRWAVKKIQESIKDENIQLLTGRLLTDKKFESDFARLVQTIVVLCPEFMQLLQTTIAAATIITLAEGWKDE